MRTTLLAALVLVHASAAAAADLVQPPEPVVMALACAARELPAASSPMTIDGSPDVTTRALFGTGEQVVIRGGAAQGVAVGQEYAVRRRLRGTHLEGAQGWVERSVHTSGWVRIESVLPAMSVGRVVWACDGILAGDYVEAATVPAVPSALEPGTPDFDAAGRVLFDNDERILGSPGRMVLAERPTGVSVEPGQRVTLFRRPHGAAGPVSVIGQGVVMELGPNTLVVLVEGARDPVYSLDDLVALQR